MKRIALYIVAIMFTASAMASNVNITVECDKPTVKLAPHLYGLFFEDINYAADGGLYAELLQNRSFEYRKVQNAHMPPLFAWDKVERGNADCKLTVEDKAPLNDKNTHYVKIDIRNSGQGVGVANRGFDGIPLKKGAKYDLSLYARLTEWIGSKTITVALEKKDGTVCGNIEFRGIGQDWQKVEGVITPNQNADAARLVITTSGQGEFYLDMVSLFPQDTFMGRKNGLRKDLAQALKDLNPKFMRFPGGCIAHGHGFDNIYRWKDTIGDVAERKPNWNLWGYHQTYGLGYFEYFQLCEDLGAAALPVLPVGVTCGFRAPFDIISMDELQPWIDDALDLIEFANGPVDSEWGAKRAAMGHPQSFDLQYICLGNEEHDNQEMRKRFPHFVRAIRKAYPNIKIIGTSGLGDGIPIYDLMTEQKVYSSDEHYYMSPDWFLNNTNRFDHFDRSKPKIFVGEYAAHDAGRVNTMYSALSEAAYLTGIERNGDIVDMTCYAPLFGRRNKSQWHPDLIYFDNHQVVKTANYYVQQLFACNKGDVYVESSFTETYSDRPETMGGAIGVGSWQTAVEFEDIRINGKKVDTSNWKPIKGRFDITNGHITQSDTSVTAAICLSTEEFAGDTVTYSLRAQKAGGREGFLIQFGTHENQSDFWWNIGGWGNTQHALQQGTGADRSVVVGQPGRIKTNQWYDIKIVLRAGNIKCYLDGKKIHDYVIKPPAISLASTLDQTAGQVILKLVNPRNNAVQTSIHLNGADSVASQGKLILLTGERKAANTFDNPNLIKPQTKTIHVGKSLNYTLPPMSLSFIRLKVN